MKATFFKGIVLGAATSAVVLAGAAAFAATGGTFILGQSNTATSTSGLTASLPTSPALDVSNPAGGPAVSFESSTAVPPFTVNSKKKVANLNADLLGGKRASAFLPIAGKAADSEKLDGLDSTAYQARVTGTCAVGHAIAVVNPDGSVGCESTQPVAVQFQEAPFGGGQVDTWIDVADEQVATDEGQRVLIQFSASTQCGGQSDCPGRLKLDGNVVEQVPFARNTDPEHEAFLTYVTQALAAGTHSISVEIYTANGTAFTMRYRLLELTPIA